MHQPHNLHVYKVLMDCMEQGKFDAFFPYLADDVKRSSMWYADDITGKDDVIAYFKDKEAVMAENDHYFSSLAYLKYIDGQPATMAESPKVVSSEGSKAGDQILPVGTKLVLWYPEGEPVVLIRTSHYSQKAPTMVRLDFDANNLVRSYNLVDSTLFAYDEVREYGILDHHDIQKLAIQEVAMHFHDLGYLVQVHSYQPGFFPHMNILQGTESQEVSVFADHAPFIGKADDDLMKSLGIHARHTNKPAIIAFVQIIGLGKEQHRILTTDPYHFTIDRLLDVEAMKAEA